MTGLRNTISTDRLFLTPLEESHQLFIQELLNTEGWIKFIGDRNIHSKEDAIAYIRKIRTATSVAYRTVKLKEGETPVGIVTLIQRDYLDQPDIGFAFLPAFSGQGYAYEASRAVMDLVLMDENIHSIHAVTLPGNKTSIALATRLGLVFDKIINVGEETLHLYTYKK